jgi:tRNA(fMet)-specific endonuclease VapC
VGVMLDSTLFIEAERKQRTPADLVQTLLDRFGDVPLSLSVMTAGELFHGIWRADGPSRRARREEYVESILSAIPAVPITLEVMRIFGEVDARLRKRGEKIPTSDLLIGSSALSRGDAVATGDPRHFGRIAGLRVHVLS